ncbi:MAG: glycosyltransferase family 87 protein [Methylovirgula sp.]
MLETFRTGAWLNRQRLQIYPLILLTAFIIAGVGLAVTAHRGIDAYGRPLGSDFSEIWVAGRAVDQGDPARPYDVAAYQRDQINVFGVKDGFYIWPYPPFFLAIAAVLALWPYGVAFAIWQSTTLGLYLATIFAVLRPARLPATPCWSRPSHSRQLSSISCTGRTAFSPPGCSAAVSSSCLRSHSRRDFALRCWLTSRISDCLWCRLSLLAASGVRWSPVRWL